VVIKRAQSVLSRPVEQPQGPAAGTHSYPRAQTAAGKRGVRWETPAQLLGAGPIQLQLGRAFPQGHN